MNQRKHTNNLRLSAVYLVTMGLIFSACSPGQLFPSTPTPTHTHTPVPAVSIATPTTFGFTICWTDCLPVPPTSTATDVPPTSTPTPVLITATPAPEPVWLVYEDQDISFQYPKTFCGTSWQENWDVYSCNEIWRVERTQSAYSSHEYAGGKEDPNGAYIQILPAYSTFGVEFGGDIQIKFIDQESFQETTKGKSLPQQTTKNGYVVLIEESNSGCCGNAYYLTNNVKYLEIRNYFTDHYHEYVLFLIDTVKLK